jgi:LacI family transcriptional regulator
LKQKKYVTIKDISKAVGVSINTVSRALNDKPDINEKTKEKILEKAKELGYIKNSFGSILKTQRSKIIGVIIPDSSNPFFSEVFKGIEEEARKNDYQTMIINTEGKYSFEEKAISTLIERRVDGILLFPMQNKYEDIEKLLTKKYPVVLVGRGVENWNVDEIYNNEIKGGFLATEHLIKKGCKKIIMISAEKFNTAGKNRELGYLKALEENKIEYKNIVNINKLHEGLYFEEGENIVQKIVDKEKVDGIFCYNDLIAYGAIESLKKKNINVPNDVKVVGYDDIRFSKIFSPSLTTIFVNKIKMGKEAFNMLKRRIENIDSTTMQITLDVELIERKSTE